MSLEKFLKENEDIKNLFDKGCIITNKSSLKNKIEVI